MFGQSADDFCAACSLLTSQMCPLQCFQATHRIQTTLTWRAQVHPETMTCTACQQLPKSHYMHLVGFDLLDRPVMYSCLEMVTNRSIEDNRRHMISCFEQV